MSRWLRFGILFLVVFLASSFLVTCSILLLLSGNDYWLILRSKALLGFLNVVFISLILTVIVLVTNNLLERRSLDKILEGVDALSHGDFSHRIEKGIVTASFLPYGEIIDGINTMAEELEGNETLKSDFIANVSHELKSPLATISACCELLQDKNQTEEEREARVSQILMTVRRLSTLVTNILRLNKLEHQEIYPKAKRFNLSSQFIECFLSFEDRWEAKGLGIDSDIEEDVFVEADEELLSLVWNNLISNAIKFTEKGGLIKVSLHQIGNEIQVSIEDTGCGISPETGRHIFDKFYQGDTSHSGEGNGLGLSMVKRVVEILEGSIDVESELGKGSTFTIRLGA